MFRGMRPLLLAVLVLGVAGYVGWKHLAAAPVPVEKVTEVRSAAGERAVPVGGVASVRAGGAQAAASKLQTFEALKARARAGDAVAQRLLAQAYQACMYVNGDRERAVRMFERSSAGMKDAAQAQVYKHLAAVRLADCDAVDGGAFAPMEVVKAWYAQAAKNGDLAARAMDDIFSLRERDTATSVQFLEEVAASGDPAAVFAFGQGVRPAPFAGAGQPYEGLTDGMMASYAWIVAACRMGYDCGPESDTVVDLCLLVNRCSGGGLEEYLRSEFKSDVEQQELDRRVEAVLGLVEGR